MRPESCIFVQNGANFYYLRIKITNDAWCKIQDLHGKSSINQDGELFHQKIGLKFKEETNKLLRLEHNFVMVLKLGHFGK